jgi:hypothetical protein
VAQVNAKQLPDELLDIQVYAEGAERHGLAPEKVE